MSKITPKVILSAASFAGALITAIAAEALQVPHLFFFSGWLTLKTVQVCREVERLMREADAARAAELADIEREIGRAVIGGEIWENAIRSISDIDTRLCAVQNTESADFNIANLIARWRRLHAEDAE